MLELQAVSKRYGHVVAVAPLDLKLDAERTYVLIGPSGCGKTTILKLMLGLIKSDSGEVFIGDQPLSEANVLQLRQRVGYVIQDGGLFPHLTARQNASLVARHLGWRDDRISQRLQDLAELTHFPQDALCRYPIQLSGGQCQRVSLIRALMLDPDVLMLDEPLGSLDPIIRSELQDDLRDVFWSLKKTVVMVTHDLSEAAFFADEVVLLHEGRIVQRGSARDLFDSPTEPFVTRFVNAQRTTLPGGA